MTKNKINWLLILQGWAMLWVVIGHSFLGQPNCGPDWENVLFVFAYSFHMPLFFVVSGWLFYRTRLLRLSAHRDGWTYKAVIKDKALRLLLPGFVFSVLAYVLKIALPGEMARVASFNLSEIIHSYLYPNDNPLRELWFVVTLFCLFLLTPLWKIVIKRSLTMYAAVVFLMLLNLWHPQIEVLSLNRVFIYAVWFYIGIVISKTDTVHYVNGWHASLMVLLLGGITYALGLYIHSLITTMGGIIISFALALLFDNYCPKLFSSFREYTYQIFLIGIFAQIFVKILYRHLGLPYLPAFILCILAGLYVPVFVSKFAEYVNINLILLCLGLKKQNTK